MIPKLDTAKLQCFKQSVLAEAPYIVGAGSEAISVKLNQNESPYDLPEAVKDTIVKSFLDIPFNRYPAEHPDRLAGALSTALNWTPSGILVGNGSNDLMYLIGLALIDRGTRVLLPRPMFSLYEKIVRLYDGELISIAPRPDLSFDAEAILEAIRLHEPSLVILTTPNNPTGLAMRPDEVEAIVAAATGLVLIDEAYHDFVPDQTARPLLDRYPHLILMRTFSKALGLAGLRLGYLVAHPDLIAGFGRARLPFSVDALSEAAALAVLHNANFFRERAAMLKRAAQDLYSRIVKLPGVVAVPTEANFLIFRTGKPASVLQKELAEAGVLVRNMSGYPELRDFVRVNAGTPEENTLFLEALNRSLV